MMEAIVNVKTTEGYLFHLFCVGFTKKFNRFGKTYSHQEVCQIWKKIMEVINRGADK